MAQHSRTKHIVYGARCDAAYVASTFSDLARDCVAKWARWTAHSTTADSTLPLSISLCAARFGDHEIRRSPATRSHLSMRQGMSANAVRGDTCRAQAMQFSAQRGKWCAIGPWIHARGTAGMPVGCSARGQAQWKAAGAESSRSASAEVLSFAWRLIKEL